MRYRITKLLVFIICLLIRSFTISFNYSYAENKEMVGFSMSPMNQHLILEPGETYEGSFSLMNPANNSAEVSFDLLVRSFYKDESGTAVFEDFNGTGKIADWITINSPTSGVINPGQSINVLYSVTVPSDAPAGGQYGSITAVSSPSKDNDGGTSATIRESVAMAYTIYAEITGNTIHQGEISGVNVPSFLFDGNIFGSSTIKNTGNVHGSAKYKLQVYPLFSNEEIYTNEENPDAKIVFPQRTVYNETIWENTPPVGIFNVVYTVEFEGVTEQVSKMVIKCPIWLLFIIIFAVVALIIWIVLRAKNKGKKSRRSND